MVFESFLLLDRSIWNSYFFTSGMWKIYLIYNFSFERAQEKKNTFPILTDQTIWISIKYNTILKIMTKLIKIKQ